MPCSDLTILWLKRSPIQKRTAAAAAGYSISHPITSFRFMPLPLPIGLGDIIFCKDCTSKITAVPLISQSKAFNFQLLCQLTRAQATEAWARASVPVPGEYPWTLSAWQGTPLNSAWHETESCLTKLHLRRGDGRGSGKRGKRRLRE